MTEQHRQNGQSDGSRTRTGCITCRIRKKKCDEQRPACRACCDRALACYGYDKPIPIWCTGKANWKEVWNSDEAKRLRTAADTRYKLSRRVGTKSGNRTSSIESNGGESTRSSAQTDHFLSLMNWSTPGGNYMLPPGTLLKTGVNIWQLRPETVWWDSKIRDLSPTRSTSSNDETRLLMIYMDVIHPITHTFHLLDSGRDRSWMLERLVSKQALYHSALSISACFETSLTQSPRINNIGICSRMKGLQSRAIRGLQVQIDEFTSMSPTPVQDFVWAGVQILDVISHLETLEIFSMLQGHWEMHHQAARRIVNHIEICVPPEQRNSDPSESIIGAALSSLPLGDAKKRSLEFAICNFIWIDVLATSTFGAHSYPPCAFDYLELLQSGTVKPDKVMGCHGQIMAIVSKISRLEQWKMMQREQVHLADVKEALELQSGQLRNQLQRSIVKLENEHNPANIASIDEDIRLVSIIWAYGAHILLQATVIEASQPNIDQTFVELCLQKLEELPTRLVMRTSWPYTIAGSMALSDAQHTRFQQIVGRVLREAQAPGISWKGMKVMEECWRLRRLQSGKRIGWREGMESLGARVILT